MTDSLISRIEAAGEGEQRALLEEAFYSLNPNPETAWKPGDPLLKLDDIDRYMALRGAFLAMLDANAFESAAMMLAKPGTLWAIGSMEDGPFARMCWPQPDGGYVGGYVEGRGSTVALAALSAILQGAEKENANG